MTRLRLLAIATALALAVALPGAVAAAQPATTLSNLGVAFSGCTAMASVDIANLVGGHDTLEFLLEDTNASVVATSTVTLGHGATSANGQIGGWSSGTSIGGLDAHLYRGPNLIASSYVQVYPAYGC